MRKTFLLIYGLILTPLSAFAVSASFTEIMYDLSGTDTGREWVEIKNTDTAEVSFLKWKLFEANTNHGLTLFQGNATTSSGGFAIIADDGAKFLTDNPTYSGTIFKSSFSLSNTGETLELKLDGVSIAQATYASSAGAAGDGNTLHYANNAWTAGAPTPGTESDAGAGAPSGGEATTTPETAAEPEEEASAPAAPQSTGSTWVYKPQMYVSALTPQKGIAGAPVLFDAVAVGSKKEPLPNAKYVWNFGDGAVAEGKKVYHTYHYPAVYVVMVDASSGEMSVTDRKEIGILAPELSIGAIKEGSEGFIEVQNNGKNEVDLSLWLLKSGSGTFTIPQGTLIGSRKSIPFPAAITRLSADALSTVLLYPNGTPVTVYSEKSAIPEAVPKQVEAPPVAPVVVPVPQMIEVEKPAPEPVKKEAPKEPVVSPAPVSPIASTSELIGAVGAAGEGSTLPWLLSVGALVTLSIGGYILTLRPSGAGSKVDELRREAATYDLIE